MTDEIPEVSYRDLPVEFDVAGYHCLVKVGEVAGAASCFLGYVDLQEGDPTGREIRDLLEAPGGLTFVREDRVGFDTGHAFMLNVDEDGDPLPGPANTIEARHASDMTRRYTAQDVVEATADLARSLARGEGLVSDGGRDRRREADEWDPESDPFACSRCGCYLGDLDRLSGRSYCRGCRRESAAACYREDDRRRVGRPPRGGRRD